ncbi:MAG: lipopolysaccharide heptosyltransferase II [Candidatus Binataceae bacterium]
MSATALSSRQPDRAQAPRPTLTPAPRRILVKELNWLGDLVLSLPTVRAIRRTWPSAQLAVLVKQELAGFFDGEDSVDEVIPYAIARGFRGIRDRARIVAQIRVRRFDLAVMFPKSFGSALLPALARVPRRAGYSADARSMLLTLKAPPPHDARSGHQANYWLAMVRETLGIEGATDDTAIAPHQGHRSKMQEWLAAVRMRPQARLVALAPFAAYGPAKEWPAPKWARLIDLLANRDGTECMLVGTASERERCAEVVAATRTGAIIAAGETGVGQLIALLSLADVVIGNDSGATHLGGALGIPTVGIFGSTDPAWSAPLGPRTAVVYRKVECSPCYAPTCRFGHHRCLEELEVEAVARAADSFHA